MLVLQFLLLLFGVGGDTEVGDGHAVGHDQSAFLKMVSLQTVTTFATFFGLVGLGTEGLGWSPFTVAVAATMAGLSALWLVGRLMRALSALHSQGNLDLQNAVGHTASVYLRIPATGQGRVMMHVQGRTVECRAVSRSLEIPTGASVRVVARTDDDVLVVEPVS